MSHNERTSSYRIHVADRAADLSGIGLEYLVSAVDGVTVMARFYNGNFLGGPPQSTDNQLNEPTKGAD